MTATAPDVRTGQQRYRLDNRIATGGMGEVWRATDTLLDREVAVKVLKHEYADDPTFRSRFEAEARHAAALQHPGVAWVYDVGDLPAEDGSGRSRPFLVMELVPGQPLSTLLHGRQPMPPRQAADLVAQAADAIAAAHAMGIVHRDLKPANLLVTPEGQVKITDFGIARAADGVALTGTGEVIGTPHYISPEQAEGRPATAASDIYALGVVLFECLTGRRPFDGDTPITTALAHLRAPVPTLPDSVPQPLHAVVTTALAKDPGQRFADAADLASALRGAPVPDSAEATRSTSQEHTQVLPASAPGPSVLPAGTAAGAAVAGASAGSALAAQDPPGAGRGRLSVGWPLAAAAVVVLLLAVLMVSVVRGGDEGNTDDVNVDPSSDVSSGDDLVRVPAAALVGTDADRAAAMLAKRGLAVDETTRANPGDQRAGTVAAVRPRGLVEPGTTVRLAVWGTPVELEDEAEADAGDGAVPDRSGKPDGKGKPGKGKGENGKSDKGNAKGKQ